MRYDGSIMNKFYPEIKKNFGFGCMRLPMLASGEVDTQQFAQMVDLFLESGFNYFDTAHGYLDGKSETALRECLTDRYPRERYILTDKLTDTYFNCEEDVRTIFQKQLDILGVSYFDFYLMHAQTKDIFQKFQKCKAYETSFALKAEGKIHHIGISFHDKAEVLEEILSTYPAIEVVQLQFNYADYDDAGIESRKCYEVCVKHGKPVLVMEPVKGGKLVKLPSEAQMVFDALHGGSNASYAIRFAAGFPQVMVVLSGMSDLSQMRDNLSFMKDFKPLDAKEMDAVHKVNEVFQTQHLIQCTACHYCTAGCPKHIPIPDLFADLNSENQYKDGDGGWLYAIHTKGKGKASDCIKCGKCEHSCPQHLPIRELLVTVAKAFEKSVR